LSVSEDKKRKKQNLYTAKEFSAMTVEKISR
jgi:hypothetical protein